MEAFCVEVVCDAVWVFLVALGAAWGCTAGLGAGRSIFIEKVSKRKGKDGKELAEGIRWGVMMRFGVSACVREKLRNGSKRGGGSRLVGVMQ